jgi:hypothetical protein
MRAAVASTPDTRHRKGETATDFIVVTSIKDLLQSDSATQDHPDPDAATIPAGHAATSTMSPPTVPQQQQQQQRALGSPPLTRAIPLPSLADYARSAGVSVAYASELDARSYALRHAEYVRDADWMDEHEQRVAVLAVGRYLALFDVDAALAGGKDAYAPVLCSAPTSTIGCSASVVLRQQQIDRQDGANGEGASGGRRSHSFSGGPHAIESSDAVTVSAEHIEASVAPLTASSSSRRVHLPHNNDIRSISASRLHPGLVVSGDFDGVLVVSDFRASVAAVAAAAATLSSSSGSDGSLLQATPSAASSIVNHGGGEAVSTWQAPASISCVLWSPTSPHVVCVATDDGAVWTINTTGLVGSVVSRWGLGNTGLFALCCIPQLPQAGSSGSSSSRLMGVGFGTGHIGVLDMTTPSPQVHATGDNDDVTPHINITLDPCVAEVGSLVSATADMDGSGSAASRVEMLASFGAGGWSLWRVYRSPPPAPLLPAMPSLLAMAFPSASSSSCGDGYGGDDESMVQGLEDQFSGGAASASAAPVPTAAFRPLLELYLHEKISAPLDAPPFPPLGYPGQAYVTAQDVVLSAARGATDYGVVAKADGCVVPAACMPQHPRRFESPRSTPAPAALHSRGVIPGMLVSDSYGRLSLYRLDALSPPHPSAKRILTHTSDSGGSDTGGGGSSDAPSTGFAAALHLVPGEMPVGEAYLTASPGLSASRYRRTQNVTHANSTRDMDRQLPASSSRLHSHASASSSGPRLQPLRHAAAVAVQRWQQATDTAAAHAAASGASSDDDAAASASSSADASGQDDDDDDALTR